MIVTSFSQRGYHLYGKRFIETFLKHWPGEPLSCYFEKKVPRDRPLAEHIQYIDLRKTADFIQFEALLKASDSIYHGQIALPNGTFAYNYRFDALKFFRKVMAITHAYANNTDPYLVWIDADVYFHQDIPEGFIESLLAEGDHIAHLARSLSYSECGFLIFRRGPVIDQFMQHYRNIYLSGAFKYSGEFHDSWLFDFVRTLLEVPATNLTRNDISNHPFNDSRLGDFMDHLKGPQRKEQGRSHPHEMKQSSVA